MISHFWNLCRACPAMDVDKLHSEYRSTYRWHEYTPKQGQVVRKPPQPTGGPATSATSATSATMTRANNIIAADGVDFPRKKKHPDVAYRSHEFFDVNGVEDSRPVARNARPAARQVSLQRRSQSEGPITRNPLFQSEYRLQFAIANQKRANREEAPARAKRDGSNNQDVKPVVSYPPSAPSSGWNRKQSSLKSKEMIESREPKKSVSMGQIQPTKNEEKTPMLDNKECEDINGNIEKSVDSVDGKSPGDNKRKDYKSEYNNRFRPFSQYEYVNTEGKFVNTSSSPPSETAGPVTPKQPKQPPQQVNNLVGEPWYQEVIELRKQANDYKCRGWGTDVVPPHMKQLYNQQMQLYEQASTRETLSSLCLAITTPRSISKDEKEKENLKKSSPLKSRSSRPRTAPAKGNKKASSRSESAQPPRTGLSTPTNKEFAKVDATPKEQQNGKVSSDSEARDKLNDQKRGISSSSSKATSRDHSRPPSAIENHRDYFKEPVVKSPPEPTRVKSPEQLMMRSPDPINWTVPLDTGKTFSVTQSVRDGDSARNSPMSDHSSHFDSVSGTAINLGVHTMNEKGSLHYPKVSALAREAKELSPKSNNKKEEKLEKCPSLEGGVTTNGTSPAVASEPVAPVAVPSNDSVTVPSNETVAVPSEKVKEVPGTSLKCLEDPTFSFDDPHPSSETKKPSYRVLEDPFEADLVKKPKNSPYKVLEDPGMMTTSIYEPASSGKPDVGKGRPEEVLDGAREQFDKFFNKGKDSSVTQ